jgi:hypothetical protein
MRNGSARHVTSRVIAGIVVAALAFGLAGCSLSSPTVSTSGVGAGGAGRSSAPQTAPMLDASKNTASGEAAIAPVPTPGGSGVDASTVAADQRLIVRNKMLRLEVTDVEGAIAKLRQMATRDGADIQNLQVATNTDEPIYRPADASTVGGGGNTPLRAYVTVRVPADKYSAFVEESAKLGKVLFQTENADDVTQQHIDLKARLVNLQAEEARLREFFKAAKTVSDMLAIEQELARVRGDIESMSAQVSYLERSAAMATVTIELAEPKPLVRPVGTDWGFLQAITDSIRAFVGVLNGIIVLTGGLLPIAIIVYLVFLIVRGAIRRHNKRVAREAAARESAAGDSGV